MRWVLAAITSVELRAMALGVLPTRELYLKGETVTVVDADDSFRVVGVWEGIEGERLGDNLPEAGALLPLAVRSKLQKDLGEAVAPEVALGASPELDGHAVGFRALSDVLSALQRFVNAVAQATVTDAASRGRYSAEVVRQAALGVLGAAPGSLRIRVLPSDERLLDTALEVLAGAVACGDDVGRLREVLAPFGQRVRARYTEILEVVRKHRLEMLSHAGPVAVYLSAATSERIIRAMAPRVEETRYTRPATGSFVAYDSAALTFEFVADDDVVYDGSVPREVAEKHEVIAVGVGAAYIVLITTIVWAGPDGRRESFELSDVVRRVDPLAVALREAL
ncbi:MAG: hypothetical protein KF915_11045 [Polyangiaceae bacterium]|nr:hypothetical protein [Polyangiaceae bacterium]